MVAKNLPLLLMAHHVGRTLAAYLSDREVNYVDTAGNCSLRLGETLIRQIDGRSAHRSPNGGRALGAPGYRLIFALLVDSSLVGRPVRAIAAAAEVSPATAANGLKQLRQDTLIADGPRGRQTIERARLLERWLRGYEIVLRPKLLIGSFRVPEQDPLVLEQRVGSLLDQLGEPWAFGGTAAAFRLTGYYRGESTTVHLATPSTEFLRRLEAIRDDDGPLTLLRTPSRTALSPEFVRTVDPLLVYTELLHNGDRRSSEAASELARRFLEDLVR